MDVILKDRRINPRTAARNAKLREIVGEILYDSARYPTYGEKVTEIVRRFGVSEREAKDNLADADRFAPEYLAANAGRIKARLLLGAESVLQRGEELVDGSRDAAAIAQARTSLAKTMDELDPARWTTGAETVTAVLLALGTCELTPEQEEILRSLGRRIQEVSDGD